MKKTYLKEKQEAQQGQAPKADPDRELLRIDIAIRLADFKGLDWDWASTQKDCLIEADQILDLINPDEIKGE